MAQYSIQRFTKKLSHAIFLNHWLPVTESSDILVGIRYILPTLGRLIKTQPHIRKCIMCNSGLSETWPHVFLCHTPSCFTRVYRLND